MVPLATFASSATRSTVVPCIPYRAITRRAASRISRTRYSLITSSFVTAKLGSQSNERTVSLGKLPKSKQGGYRAGKRKPMQVEGHLRFNTGNRGSPLAVATAGQYQEAARDNGARP